MNHSRVPVMLVGALAEALLFACISRREAVGPLRRRHPAGRGGYRLRLASAAESLCQGLAGQIRAVGRNQDVLVHLASLDMHAHASQQDGTCHKPHSASRLVAQPHTGLRLRDDGSGVADEKRWRIVEAADRRASPARAHELDGGLKLRPHRSRLEFLQIQIVRTRSRH